VIDCRFGLTSVAGAGWKGIEMSRVMKIIWEKIGFPLYEVVQPYNPPSIFSR
jgi:hypothetical protein